MKPPRIRELAPVQVYLDRQARERLDRLARHLETSKSDILRRGIEALEQEVLDPASHPALRLIGVAEREVAAPLPYDVAREHDRFIAEAETEPRTGRRERAKGARPGRG